MCLLHGHNNIAAQVDTETIGISTVAIGDNAGLIQNFGSNGTTYAPLSEVLDFGT